MTEVQSKATQCRNVLEFMREHGAITTLQAVNALGVMRLASRVHDLRNAGHDIKVETISVPTREKGKFARVAQYSIIKEAHALPESAVAA
jgi:hypothetical protein